MRKEIFPCQVQKEHLFLFLIKGIEINMCVFKKVEQKKRKKKSSNRCLFCEFYLFSFITK